MTIAPDRRPLAFRSLDDVVDALRDSGHRVSAPARRVLEELFAADGAVSAERIAAGRGDGGPALDLTSVYRNLERLEQLGVVSHVHVGHGPGLYALARDGDAEYLVCDRCGRVTSVDPAALDGVRAAIRQAFGHDARFAHFPIHGRCAACAEDG
jgi:Fur family ferric uptake transcriptional regulator